MSEELDMYEELASELDKTFGRRLTTHEILVLDLIGMPKYKVGDKVWVALDQPFVVDKIICGQVISDQPAWFYAPAGSTLFTDEELLEKED